MHPQPNHLRRLHGRLFPIALAALLSPFHLLAEDRVFTPDVLANPDTIAAIRTAWSDSANGRTGIEASFRLDGRLSAYRIVVTPFTNQRRTQTVPIIPGVTFAVFHVHTAKADPEPSPADREIADRYKLKMYSIHTQGLYVYDPVTRKTAKLRDGVDWVKTALAGEPILLTKPRQ
jgi:hypothetical protein